MSESECVSVNACLCGCASWAFVASTRLALTYPTTSVPQSIKVGYVEFNHRSYKFLAQGGGTGGDDASFFARVSMPLKLNARNTYCDGFTNYQFPLEDVMDEFAAALGPTKGGGGGGAAKAQAAAAAAGQRGRDGGEAPPPDDVPRPLGPRGAAPWGHVLFLTDGVPTRTVSIARDVTITMGKGLPARCRWLSWWWAAEPGFQ